MKKVALIFLVAVLLPSLVLAWLAVRSLRDQQFLLERQQSLLCQRVTDSLAQNIGGQLAQWQQEFGARVEEIVDGQPPRSVAAEFDSLIRRQWPLAEVGFCVTTAGKILAPAPGDRPEAEAFYSDNRGFLGNRETAEVYWNAYNSRAGVQNAVAPGQNQVSSANTFARGSLWSADRRQEVQTDQTINGAVAESSPAAAVRSQLATASRVDSAARLSPPAPSQQSSAYDVAKDSGLPQPQAANTLNYKQAQTRKVSPQSQLFQNLNAEKSQPAGIAEDEQRNLSKVVPAEAEFSQLVGNENDGMLARFRQNKLKLMLWHRLGRSPDLIFGAELNLNRVVDGLRDLVQAERGMNGEVCLALLDDNARPVVLSRPDFKAAWKRPFVATEVGDALPHWEVAAYLVDPARLTQAARTAKITLGLLVVVLLVAIGVGSWLIVRGLNAELRLARQKTDFVSNVSHELKTPLTSIRMFSELLAEGRVSDHAKQRSYLNIITAEAARLTRLINNVLDFSRMERGEKKYHFQTCDVTEIARATAETFRPHLESAGFKFSVELPEATISINGDADALSQVLVNLLSNAEKYSNGADSTPSPRPSGERVGVRGTGPQNQSLLTQPRSSLGEGEREQIVCKEITLQLLQKHSPLPHAEIRVLDRGSGVPRGSEEKIFEKFYRAHDSLSNGIQGSGLGLTIARQIARAHGGNIAYEPREGGGSCFIVRLPISTTDEQG
jgi:signal transduction histidine kinase